MASNGLMEGKKCQRLVGILQSLRTKNNLKSREKQDAQESDGIPQINEVEENATGVAEFFWNKLYKSLEEAENELFSGLIINSCTQAIASGFQNIKIIMESSGCKMKMRSSTESEICKWLYKVDDALAEYRIFAQQMKSHNNKIRFNIAADLRFSRRMKSQLDSIRKEFDKMEHFEERAVPYRILARGRVRARAQLTFGGDDVKKVKVEDIVLYDKSNNKIEFPNFGIVLDYKSNDKVVFKAIGIYGMGGTGKTTLVRQVFNSQEVKKEFTKRIWVCLSAFQNKEQELGSRIVRSALEQLGHDVDGSMTTPNLTELLNELHDKLSEPNGRYLIVLDDVWLDLDFYANLDEGVHIETHFSWGLPKNPGGVVIITGRLERVARRIVGEKHLFRLGSQLGEKRCWEIFENNLYANVKVNERPMDEKNLANLKHDIIYQCHGLPLAAEVLAHIISKEDRELRVSQSLASDFLKCMVFERT